MSPGVGHHISCVCPTHATHTHTHTRSALKLPESKRLLADVGRGCPRFGQARPLCQPKSGSFRPGVDLSLGECVTGVRPDACPNSTESDKCGRTRRELARFRQTSACIPRMCTTNVPEGARRATRAPRPPPHTQDSKDNDAKNATFGVNPAFCYRPIFNCFELRRATAEDGIETLNVCPIGGRASARTSGAEAREGKTYQRARERVSE